ncbi:lactate/malate family dehydrogenase [Vibrio vulnificus]|uniref:lactate/malate family dehydrogenase n=1 Tax=Vibrio vulnificus TaxID=672 RepID=UPI00188D8BD1|nr:L-lactate dehydrogenase [Vibrio vulnificus]MBF4452980.1 L-lactate dehydrogenase [Vibrio vulnificus]MBF4498671.1 L-lactate dehydrogenase [Vibrio vulnificus]MBL6181081.1 L-lactate dehydrogenase [Vibrio vulnificus]HDY7983147.1 L-lactate dehydrogenase [Vibrio vulnificus]HDY8006634.1 L-lactate dehydrogenase [Vibrio vulnificus]
MKIGVIGAGSVGVGICNYLLTMGSVSELVLLDQNLERAEGEVFDFRHTAALTFSKNTHIIPTKDYLDLLAADIVVITAGAQIKQGQTRIDIARQVERVAPNAILIVVSNPCDLVSHFIVSNTTFKPSKVISSGCVIDTARLMTIVANRVQLDPKNVFGYVLGEHGSHCFTPKSLISIAGQPADYYCDTNHIKRIDADELLESVKQAGYEIFKRKHNTTHGISASVFRIIQAIMINEKSVLPVGTMLSGQYGLDNVLMSLPTVVGKQGAEKVLMHPFSDEELSTLARIAENVTAVVNEVAQVTGLKA